MSFSEEENSTGTREVFLERRARGYGDKVLGGRRRNRIVGVSYSYKEYYSSPVIV